MKVAFNELMMMECPVRVYLIEGSRLFSEAVAGVLRRHEDFELVGIGSDPDAVTRRLREGGVDVVLVDGSVKRRELLDLTSRLQEEFPKLKVLALGLDSEERILEFIEAGAQGFLARDASSSDLLQTIRVVEHGCGFSSLHLAASVHNRIAEFSHPEEPRPQGLAIPLTPRELEVLEAMADGLTNKEIAQQLSIRTSTAKNHVHNILQKLQVRTRREAIRAGYELGLLQMPHTW